MVKAFAGRDLTLDPNPQWGRCPRHLRITPYGAARKTWYNQPWKGTDKFWLVTDLHEGKSFPLPTINACLKLNLFGERAIDSLSKIADNKLIHANRWLVERIPKLKFFKLGGRRAKLCWTYKEEVADREERLEEIRSGRYRPVPVAKHEKRAVQIWPMEDDVLPVEAGELEHISDGLFGPEPD